MSIASEFDSTIENIKSDYEGLENIGADLTNIDKNIYNIRTCLDNIYTNLPKTTGEGSNLSLTTLKGRINVDDILGDTEQDSTTGINLFIPSLKNVDTDTTIIKSNAVSSLTLSNNEFTFVASGADVYFGQVTAVGGSYSNANGNKINVGSATKISYRLTNTAFNRGHFTAYDSNNISLGYTGIPGNTGTYTIPSGTSYVTFRFGKNDATSGTTYKTKVIVALGDTIPDYQDYTGGTASPNPTYPQDINVVTGTQEVVVQNKNILNMPDMAETTISGLTIKVQNNTIYLNGTQTGGSINPYNIIPTDMYLEAGTYTLGSTFSGSTSVVQNFALYLNGTGTTIYYTSSHSKTFTLTERTQITRIAFWTQTNTAYNNVVSKIQLEKGSTKTDFVEHQEQTKTLHLSSKNLCNLNLNTTTIAGVTLTKNNDNTITANGTATSTIAVNILNNNGGTSTDNLTLPKGTYTLSGCPSGGGTNTNYKLDLVRNNGPLITDTGTSATYTATSDTAYSGIRIVIYSGTTCNNLIFKPMLNEGSTATTYEPYYNYELAKIGTYKNRIFETSRKNLFGGTLYNGQVGSQGSWVSSTNRITNINADGVVGELFLEKGTYTISMPNLDLCSALTKNASGTILDNFANSWNSLPFTFTLTQDGYLSFTGRKNDNSNITASNFVVMLNEGSTALPYEPYGSDKWYIEKNIGKVNLENIPWTGATTASGYKLYATEQIRDIKYVSANTIVGEGLAYNFIMHTGNGMSHPSALNCIAIDTNAVRIQTTSQAPTGIFYYALATPTYTEITNETLLNELNELEKMMSYNGQTNISVSGNLPMILDVSALKGE